jgi:hypothetical protein
MKKRGEEDEVAVGMLDWREPVPVLDTLGSTVGETVDEKAPGSRVVVFTVDATVMATKSTSSQKSS